MATHFFGADIPALLPRPTDECPEKTPDQVTDANPELLGNIFRGFFFAMLFNLILLLALAAVWELWRILR